MTVLGNFGVTVDTALTFTGSLMPFLRAYSRLVNTTAAPPSDVVQILSSRSGSLTIALARISSSVTSLRYRAFGLFSPWRAFLIFTAAQSFSVEPYSSMRRRA